MKTILINSGKVLDISELTQNKTSSGSITTAARVFQTSFLNKDSDIELEDGASITVFSNEDAQLFKGLIFDQSSNENQITNIKCYDNMFYFSNNSDVFSFIDVTADKILAEIANRFQLTIEIVDSSSYLIPSVPIKKMTLWELFKNIQKQIFDATGEKYILKISGDTIQFLKRRNQIHQWVIEPEKNLISYNYTRNIENIKSKIKLMNTQDKQTIIATSEDTTLKAKVGTLQYFEAVYEDMNQASLNELAKQMQLEKGQASKTFDLSCIGIDNVVSGDGIFVSIPSLNIKKSFYIEKDTHNYFDGKHTMDLKLIDSLEL